jgi:3-oxoacyl-[acyl-carrier-protein] synthase III
MPAEGCGIGIVGLGVALPATVRTNDFWDVQPSFEGTSFETVDPFRGTVARRVLEEGRDSVDLEVEACLGALANALTTAQQVRVLLGASGTPTHLEPGNHVRVARRLGVAPWTMTMSMAAACAVAIPQLETAVRLMAAQDGCALVYQSSAFSRTMDYASPLAPLVGDGAVAQVIGPVDAGLGLVGTLQAIRTEFADGIVVGRPDGLPWYSAAPGGGIVVSIQDADVARAMIRRSPELARQVCLRLLDQHGYVPADVDAFISIQPAVDFAASIARAVGVPEGRWLEPAEHFEQFGHTMHASVMLNLYLAWRAGKLRVGDLVLVYSQGAGFVQGATLMRWALPAP